MSLLSQPKVQRGAAKASKEPIKVFGPSPVTSQPVRVILGRYGPYVTDGVTNASLPKDAPPDEINFEYALNLLQARVDAGPSKRSFRRKSGGKTAGKSAGKAPKKPAAKKK
jgi:DNA topoisomerase-1